jgi:5'-3' exoribonuclease 1
MGVPYYYRKVWEKFPEVIVTQIALVWDLYFDFNGLIHWAITEASKERVYQSKYHNSYIDFIFKLIEIRVDQHVKLVNPQKRIIICIDGQAVRGKMKQQIQRRSKGPVETEMRKNIKRQYGEEVNEQTFDRVNATPGTEFMHLLNKFVKKIAIKYSKHYEVIISDSNEAGEGEHKLFNFLKRNSGDLVIDKKNPENSQKIVIVGLDADLIMLSLVTHYSNLYLMRESVEKNVKDADNIFTYIDIGLFRQLLVSEIRYNIKAIDKTTLYQKETTESIIDDYIFMCFLLGNDFIPHSPTLSIKHGGIDRLIRHYVYIFNEIGEHLVTIENRNDPDKITAQINFEPVKRLIMLLANEEDEEMKKVFNERCKLEKRPPRNWQNKPKTPADVDLHRLSYLPAFEVGKELDLEIDGFPGWKMKYFNHVLRMKRTETNINAICKNYLEGLNWVLQYYYTENHSWGWMYFYIASPLFQDLAKYLQKCDTFPVETEKRMVPYSPLTQLMMVISKRSANLLPKPLKDKMTHPESDIAHYYPDDFELNLYFHVQFWETEPILPMIDDVKIETIVNSAPLTKDEIERNSPSKMYVIKKQK